MDFAFVALARVRRLTNASNQVAGGILTTRVRLLSQHCTLLLDDRRSGFVDRHNFPLSPDQRLFFPAGPARHRFCRFVAADRLKTIEA